jgi:hypothetical protein
MPFRYFLVDPGGTPRRFPVARYERLVRRESGESLKEFSSGWACFAQLYFRRGRDGSVFFANPVYICVRIGEDGLVDPASRREYEHTAMGAADPGFSFEDGTIAGERFWAARRLREQFTWQPTALQQRIMREAVQASGRRHRI